MASLLFLQSTHRSGLPLQMLALRVPLTIVRLSWLEIRSDKGFRRPRCLMYHPVSYTPLCHDGSEKGMKMRVDIEGKYLTKSSERLHGCWDVRYCFLRKQEKGVQRFVVLFCSTFSREYCQDHLLGIAEMYWKEIERRNYNIEAEGNESRYGSIIQNICSWKPHLNVHHRLFGLTFQFLLQWKQIASSSLRNFTATQV